MSKNKEHFVAIADDCGDTCALVGPFSSQATAQTWVDRREAETDSNALEPYVVLELNKPEDFE